MLDDTDLTSRLADPDLLTGRAYLAGVWTDAEDGKTFQVTNPARGDVLAEVADLSRAEIASAIDKGKATIATVIPAIKSA